VIYVALGCIVLLVAALTFVLRDELVEARVRAVERSRWLHGRSFSTRKSNTALVWIAIALLVGIGLSSIALGLIELA
jgi:hypothetical protein